MKKDILNLCCLATLATLTNCVTTELEKDESLKLSDIPEKTEGKIIVSDVLTTCDHSETIICIDVDVNKDGKSDYYAVKDIHGKTDKDGAKKHFCVGKHINMRNIAQRFDSVYRTRE